MFDEMDLDLLVKQAAFEDPAGRCDEYETDTRCNF